jgi:hypothetical protein
MLHQINAGGVTTGANAVASPFVGLYNDQQHIAYRDDSGRILDAWFNPQLSQWNLQQLNLGGRTTGPAAVAGPCIGKYNNQQHFAYVDGQGMLWDSWYDGDRNRWNLQQLNMGGLTDGPAAHPGFPGKDLGPVSIWVDPSGSQQHFAYLATDDGIYDLFWNSSINSWEGQKLNAGGKTNGPPAASSPFGCVFHSQQHVAYLDSAGGIYDSWYDGNGKWSLQQIGGTASVPNQTFVWVSPDETNATQQHFTYLGTDGAIYDAYWDSALNNWQAQKLNAKGNTSGPLSASMAAVCVGGGEEHICYIDTGGNVWDSFRNATGNWSAEQVPIGPAAMERAFAWTNGANTEVHITYKDSNGVIWDAIQALATAGSGQ